MRVLRGRLLEMKREEQEKQLSALRGEYVKTEWGSQIRSYVLHPYQLVKDHRTDFETGNTKRCWMVTWMGLSRHIYGIPTGFQKNRIQR